MPDEIYACTFHAGRRCTVKGPDYAHPPQRGNRRELSGRLPDYHEISRRARDHCGGNWVKEGGLPRHDHPLHHRLEVYRTPCLGVPAGYCWIDVDLLRSRQGGRECLRAGWEVILYPYWPERVSSAPNPWCGSCRSQHLGGLTWKHMYAVGLGSTGHRDGDYGRERELARTQEVESGEARCVV